PRVRTGANYWNQPIIWNRHYTALGIRERVFCSSLGDVFDEEVPDPWRDDLFALIRCCPNLDWQLLTKRPIKMHDYLCHSSWWMNGPPSNIWLGVSVEDQPRADQRIPFLIDTPARVRFLSCEPLLEPLQLDLQGIHWVIVGGESGPGARPMHPEWARRLRGQCKLAGVPFFFKQWSAFVPLNQLSEPYVVAEKGHVLVD